MTLHELVTLTLQPATTGKALPVLERALADDAGGATLLGCWTTDIGALNQVVLLRRFADDRQLLASRQAVPDAPSPFGCGEWLAGMTRETLVPFPFLPDIAPGRPGPVYELRRYGLKPGGLRPTLAAWEAAVPGRTGLSPLAAAFHTLDGIPRIVHLWPYRSLDDRAALRAEAVRAGVWPPKGGPDWLTADMQSTIMVPVAFSPLQ